MPFAVVGLTHAKKPRKSSAVGNETVPSRLTVGVSSFSFRLGVSCVLRTRRRQRAKSSTSTCACLIDECDCRQKCVDVELDVIIEGGTPLLRGLGSNGK
jgi:hypothetical protein